MHGKLHIRHKSQKNFEALDDFFKNDITRLFKKFIKFAITALPILNIQNNISNDIET